MVGGGRNIGDEYFDAAAEVNFRDLDVLIVGSGVAQAAREFDRYWTSAVVVSVETFNSAAPLDGGLAELRAMLDGAPESDRAKQYLQRLQTSPLIAQLVAGQRGLLAVDDDALRIISDPPEKARGVRGGELLDAIVGALGEARREVLMISPYFVPGERGADVLVELVRRGEGLGAHQLARGHRRDRGAQRLCALPQALARGGHPLVRAEAQRRHAAKQLRLERREPAHQGLRGR